VRQGREQETRPVGFLEQRSRCTTLLIVVSMHHVQVDPLCHMNRKQRRAARSQNAHHPLIQFRGRSYTIADAGTLATQHHSRRHYKDAVALWSLIVDAVPDNASAYYNRGLAHHELHRYALALADYDKALTLRAPYASAHYNKAVLLHTLGRDNDALISCRAVIRSSLTMPPPISAKPMFSVVCNGLKRHWLRAIKLSTFSRVLSLPTMLERLSFWR